MTRGKCETSTTESTISATKTDQSRTTMTGQTAITMQKVQPTKSTIAATATTKTTIRTTINATTKMSRSTSDLTQVRGNSRVGWSKVNQGGKVCLLRCLQNMSFLAKTQV